MLRFLFPLRVAVCCLLSGTLVAGPLSFGGASGQIAAAQKKAKARKKGRKGKKTPSIRAIDVRAKRAVDTFLREAAETAKEYEKAGQFEKSKMMLRAILKLNPSLAGVKSKIKQLDEGILSANQLDFDVDVNRGWGAARARVFKGRPIRIQAGGKYRFVVADTVGPAGFSGKNPVKGDMAAGIPAGALMGLIASKGKGGKTALGKPFLIGNALEITPKADGLLFLTVNAPPGHKSKGKLRVRIGGSVRLP